MRKWLTIAMLMCAATVVVAQETAGDAGAPTFVPTVKVSKVLRDGDSIQYMEMSNVYVYPQMVERLCLPADDVW